MKHLMIIFIFVAFTTPAFSQKIRFTDGSNVWKLVQEEWDAGVYVLQGDVNFGGDTIINGLDYKKLYNNDVLVREDTAAKKVYCRAAHYIPYYFVDTTEVLLYDYNLVVGDTFTMHVGGNTWRHGVVSIDSFSYNGAWYKVWLFSGRLVTGSGPAGKYIVVEGIGCIESFSTIWPLFGPLYPVGPFEHFNHVLCFSNQSGRPPIHPGIPYLFPIWQSPVHSFDNDTSCKVRVSVNTINAANAAVVVFPNPANSNSVLNLYLPIKKGSLFIYNSIGQCVGKATLVGQDNIPIGKYISTPGQYFYRIIDIDKNQSYTGRFIFE